MYAKLFRYMLSIGLSGVIITQSWDLEHTAYTLLSVITTLISLGINILPYYKPRRLLFQNG